MDDQRDEIDHRETELRQKEAEIAARERAIRLREMESELYQDAPFYQTTKVNPPETKLQTWLKKAGKLAKFMAIVICVVVAVKIAYWMALAVLVGAISWIGYRIFVDSDRAK